MISVTAAKNRARRQTPLHSRMLWTRVVTALVFLTVIVYFYPHPQVSHYKFEQGRPWNYAKLIAPFDVPVHPDSASMKSTVDSLNAVFVPVYRHVSVNVDSITQTAISRMEDFSNNRKQVKGENSADRRRFYSLLSTYLAGAYRRGVIADSLPMEFGTRHKQRARMLENNVLRTIATTAFVPRMQVIRDADSLAAVYGQSAALQNSGLSGLVMPSIICDETESRRILNNEIALVTIDRGVIQRGQTIIDKGAVITPQDYTNIRTYETMLHAQLNETSRNDILMLCGQILYVVLLLISFMAYLYLFEYESVWQSLKNIFFLLGLCTVFFLITVAVNTWVVSGIYIVPLAIVTVLTLVFFNGRTALMTGVFEVMLIAGITSYPLEFVFMQFVAVSAAVLSMRQLTQRSQLLRASFLVGVSYILAYIAIQLMTNGSFDDFSWRVIIFLVVNAMLTSMAYILMFVIERLFGFVSNVTLVELTDTNSQLLRELSDECPGTFQHSMSVATLATDAARSIGADILLTRAGAMYHDIGKMGNPIFFTENQHGVNPHDGLSPEKSAEIIIGHVSEGLRRADKARIPSVIRKFISEHHGRGVAKYFYVTACNKSETPVDPAPFTYPGPNPRSRETSVLMMADAVEAASRSLKEHTPEAIKALVNRIIDGQIADGLHNESPLHFNDVPRIKEAFIKRLMTMYHSRVQYPDRKPSEQAESPAAGDEGFKVDDAAENDQARQ